MLPSFEHIQEIAKDLYQRTQNAKFKNKRQERELETKAVKKGGKKRKESHANESEEEEELERRRVKSAKKYAESSDEDC